MKTIFIKRAVFVIIMVFLCNSVVSASDKPGRKLPTHRYEVTLGWGGWPLLEEGKYDSETWIVKPAFSRESYLNQIYKDYEGPLYSTGAISAKFSYYFRRWFALSLDMNFNYLFRRIYSSVNLGEVQSTENGYTISIMPQARFNYLSKQYVTLYGYIGLGVMVTEFGNHSCEVYPAVQAVPFGITVGKKVFGFVEFGYGTSFFGGMAGIGVRF